MAHEGDARANTMRRIPVRFRLLRPRSLISEQQPSSMSFTAPSFVSAKRRKKMVRTFSLDDDFDDGYEDFHFLEEDEDLGGASIHAPPDERVRAAVVNVTVGDADALECGICFVVLRPPIFQCEVGHVVCSSCRDKLEATGNGTCHVCRAATCGGYRRCYAMERLVDCIRVPCPYAAHGCDATPPYHGQESHRQVCPHAPCHCPGKSCSFIGSTAMLVDHFAGAHNWPCTTKVCAVEGFSICLHDGFNFILADHDRRDDGGQAGATWSSVPCRLFLLNVTKERLGRAISVLCIHPHTSATAANSAQQQLPLTQFELVFSCYDDKSSCRSHYQSSVFIVVCTDLSNGLPNPEGCFQFFVPNAVLGIGDQIQVKARIIN